MRALLVLAAACSSTPSSGVVAVPVLPDVPFALLDRTQRETFMRERVVPAMAPLFRDFDAKRFPTITCTTCHADTYEMPNPELPKLRRDQWALNRSAHDPRIVDFMTTKVVPAMQRMLDDDSLDCMRCHELALD